MIKLALILLSVAATTWAEEDPQVTESDGSEVEPSSDGERFLAVATTSTVYVPTTVVAFTTVAQTCYSTVNITGPCRRRRGIEEEPMILAFEEEVDIQEVNPSSVLSIEETELVTHEQVRALRELQGSSSSSSIEEIELFGLGQACNVQARKLKVPLIGLKGPNLTVLKVITSTFTDIIYSTVTSGQKPFTVAGCTPATFAYPAC